MHERLKELNLFSLLKEKSGSNLIERILIISDTKRLRKLTDKSVNKSDGYKQVRNKIKLEQFGLSASTAN